MTEARFSPAAYAAEYPRFVEPPVQYVAFEWTGNNLADAEAFLSTHGIAATALLAGSNVLLLLPASGTPPSITYQPGFRVMVRSDGDQWYLDTTRTDTTGLAPFGDFYVTQS